MEGYKIAVIVAWFGKLPGYFPAWLRSAERNPDIDFFFFCDQEVKTESSNIFFEKTTLERETMRATKVLKEKVEISSAYKFCDLRPFFGLVYADYLVGYDYWGYCDIDLVFGQIRRFLTDDILSGYERFYEWGHFSLFKNDEKMNHIYDLSGCLYTRDETLRGTVKVNAEEHYGINRICQKNDIAWYQKIDFADFYVYCSDLQLSAQRHNYVHQVFYWEDGRAYRAAIGEQGNVLTDEYVYIHWQKRNPKLDSVDLRDDSFFITTDRLYRKEKGIPSAETIIRIAPEISREVRKKEKRIYFRKKICEFMKAPKKRKQIWLRQKKICMEETGSFWGQI